MFKQATILCWLTLLAFRQRLMSASVSIISIACVAAVMLSVLALTYGMLKTLNRSGLDSTVLVMRAGAASELQSVLFPAEVNILANHKGIKRDADNNSIVSAEMFVSSEYKGIQNLQTSGSKQLPNEQNQTIALRGISQKTFEFRPNFSLAAGTLFKTGVKQVIVGQAVARRFPEIKVGSTMILGSSTWLVAGIFADNNSVFESEVWADLGVVQSEYQRGNTIQSVRLALAENADLTMLKKEWQADPRLNLRIMQEKQFFAEQGQKLTRLIRWIGFPVALVMALGASIAALNTMYGAIAGRVKEIATQKAIGFAASAIFSSVIFEALIIAALGALIGILPLYLLFDGWTAATKDNANLSQMMFNFDLNIILISKTVFISLIIGVFGGLFPAIKAVRMPVTEGLKQ